MEKYLSKEKKEKIIRILKENPRGLTVQEMSKQLDINRNSVAKYLDILTATGYVGMKTIGPAKVYYAEKKVPINAIMNLTKDFFVVISDELRVIDANKSFLDFFSMEKENTINEHITNTQFIKSLDTEYLNDLIQKALQGEENEIEIKISKNNEKRRATEEEEGHYFNIKFIPTILEDSKSAATIMFEDITESKLAFEELKKSERRFNSIIQDQTEMIARFNADGIVTFANDAYCKFIGKSHTNIIGKKMPLPLTGGSLEKYKRKLKEITPHKPVITIEYKALDRADKVVWHQTIIRGIFHEGELIEYQSVARDITDRKNYEKELKTKTKFENFILSVSKESINVSRYMVDRHIHSILKKLAEYTGVERSYIYIYDFESSIYDRKYDYMKPGYKDTMLPKEFPKNQLQFIQYKIDNKQPVIIETLEDIPRKYKKERELYELIKIKSLFIMPLIYGTNVIGVLGIYSTEEHKDWLSGEIDVMLNILSQFITNIYISKYWDSSKEHLALQK